MKSPDSHEKSQADSHDTPKIEAHVKVDHNELGGVTATGKVGAEIKLLGAGAGAGAQGSVKTDANGNVVSVSGTVSADVGSFDIQGQGQVTVTIDARGAQVKTELDVKTTEIAKMEAKAATAAAHGIANAMNKLLGIHNEFKTPEFQGAHVHVERSFDFSPGSNAKNNAPAAPSHDWVRELDPNNANPQNHYNESRQQCEPDPRNSCEAPPERHTEGVRAAESHGGHDLGGSLGTGHTSEHAGSGEHEGDHPGGVDHHSGGEHAIA